MGGVNDENTTGRLLTHLMGGVLTGRPVSRDPLALFRVHLESLNILRYIIVEQLAELFVGANRRIVGLGMLGFSEMVGNSAIEDRFPRTEERRVHLCI